MWLIWVVGTGMGASSSGTKNFWFWREALVFDGGGVTAKAMGSKMPIGSS